METVVKSGRVGRKYPVVQDGEAMEVNWRTHDFKMECCDCGLVHRLRFSVVKNKLRIRVWRDNRATGQARRRIKRQLAKKGN